MFETLIVQPIFNLLLILYALLGDFGLAIILFTLFVRTLMWPLLRKQLHQTRVMRKLNPEIKAIRKKYNGDRQAESAAMMELYRENGVNPVGQIGLLFVQLPIFFGLFSALRSFINDPARLVHLPYEYVRGNQAVQDMLATIADKTNSAVEMLGNGTIKETLQAQLGNPVQVEQLQQLSESRLNELFNTTLVADAGEKLVQGPFFDQHLFGFIDLSGRAIGDGGVYLPVLIIALLAGIFQYMQTRQITPHEEESKSLRQIMSDSAKSGKEPDQSEISAALGKRMGLFFAPLITIISATSPAGLALYFATNGVIGFVQQRFVLKEDVEEMELMADASESSKNARKAAHKQRSKGSNKDKPAQSKQPAKKQSKKKNTSKKSTKKGGK